MITEEIRQALFSLQDSKYRDFQTKLIPGTDTESMIGVRTSELRKLAKQMVKREDIREFLQDLPHIYFDENQIHAFIISEMKEYEKCMEEVSRFLPFVDNWATCDQMSPKVFRKHKPELFLQQHFLDEDFDPAYADLVAGIHSEEYYINMMIAWYFATALAKQYDAVLPFIEEHRLDPWVHNKTIQKAIESYRVSEEQKSCLRTLKIRSKPVSST